MNVCLCSAFRNASNYLARYFAQIDALQEALAQRGDWLQLILAFGDCVDDTGKALYSACQDRSNVWILHIDHGGPDYGSVVNAERFANLARVWNRIWSHIPEDADAVLFVESDLIWDAPTLLALLDRLESVAAIAPMVMLKREGFPRPYFYDTWAARKSGQHFTWSPPYHEWLNGDMIQVDSAGSCLAIRAELARKLTWPDDVIVGVCRQINQLGESVWIEPRLEVVHE